MAKSKLTSKIGIVPRVGLEPMKKIIEVMEPGKCYHRKEIASNLGGKSIFRVGEILSMSKVLAFVESRGKEGVCLTPRGELFRKALLKGDGARMKKEVREGVKGSDFIMYIGKLWSEGLDREKIMGYISRKYKFKIKNKPHFRSDTLNPCIGIYKFAFEKGGIKEPPEKVVKEKVKRMKKKVAKKKKKIRIVADTKPYYLLGRISGLISARGQGMDMKEILNEIEKVLSNLDIDPVVMNLFQGEKKLVEERDDLSLLEPLLNVVEKEILE